MGIEEVRKSRMDAATEQASRYSQAAIADAVGVSRPTLRKWCEHPEMVPIGKAQALADYFGCSMEEFFSMPKKGN